MGERDDDLHSPGAILDMERSSAPRLHYYTIHVTAAIHLNANDTMTTTFRSFLSELDVDPTTTMCLSLGFATGKRLIVYDVPVVLSFERYENWVAMAVETAEELAVSLNELPHPLIPKNMFRQRQKRC
jgi:hypothetical protein